MVYSCVRLQVHYLTLMGCESNTVTTTIIVLVWVLTVGGGVCGGRVCGGVVEAWVDVGGRALVVVGLLHATT